MRFAFVFMMLQLAVLSVAAQDFGTVVCTDYNEPNVPQVTLASSGTTSVTGACSVSGGTSTIYRVTLSSPNDQTTCQVSLSAPSYVGNHELDAKLYYANSQTGPWTEATNRTFTFSATRQTITRYVRVGGILTLRRFTEGVSTANGTLTTTILGGTGSCLIL